MVIRAKSDNGLIANRPWRRIALPLRKGWFGSSNPAPACYIFIANHVGYQAGLMVRVCFPVRYRYQISPPIPINPILNSTMIRTSGTGGLPEGLSEITQSLKLVTPEITTVFSPALTVPPKYSQSPAGLRHSTRLPSVSEPSSPSR